MGNVLNVGVIGLGRIGKLHINNLKSIPEIRIKTGSDLTVDHLQEWADSCGIEKLTTDSNDIFQDPDIDAVFICSSTDTHSRFIIEAARAGKHIFCEKPISLSVEESEAAVKAAEEAGVQLQVGFNRRFDVSMAKAKNVVAAGDIGDVHVLKITSRDPQPPGLEYVAVSGGIFIDMTIHDFDMARYLTGSEVVEVYAKGAALVNPAVAELGDVDTAVTTLTFANGAIGVIDNSRQAAYGYDQRVEVFGNKGSVAVDNQSQTQVKHLGAAAVALDTPVFFFLERYNQAFIEEVNQFVAAIQQGTPVPCSGKDALAAQLIAVAAKESLATGKRVEVRRTPATALR